MVDKSPFGFCRIFNIWNPLYFVIACFRVTRQKDFTMTYISREKLKKFTCITPIDLHIICFFWPGLTKIFNKRVHPYRKQEPHFVNIISVLSVCRDDKSCP